MGIVITATGIVASKFTHGSWLGLGNFAIIRMTIFVEFKCVPRLDRADSQNQHYNPGQKLFAGLVH